MIHHCTLPLKACKVIHTILFFPTVLTPINGILSNILPDLSDLFTGIITNTSPSALQQCTTNPRLDKLDI